MGAHKGLVMETELATDDVTDSIAYIEMHRQVRTEEAGLAVSCSEALRKLHDLLDHQRAALRRPGSGAPPSANIDALTIEIDKVKRLTGGAGGGGTVPKQPSRAQQQVPRQNARPNPARNKARRTMGRFGDR